MSCFIARRSSLCLSVGDGNCPANSGVKSLVAESGGPRHAAATKFSQTVASWLRASVREQASCQRCKCSQCSRTTDEPGTECGSCAAVVNLSLTQVPGEWNCCIQSRCLGTLTLEDLARSWLVSLCFCTPWPSMACFSPARKSHQSQLDRQRVKMP